MAPASLVAEFISPKKGFSSIVDNVKCIHSATKHPMDSAPSQQYTRRAPGSGVLSAASLAHLSIASVGGARS